QTSDLPTSLNNRQESAFNLFFAFDSLAGMGTEKQHLFHFPPFRLDPANQQLWCGDAEVHLRSKTFEVLHYLVKNRAQLVTKAALLDVLWPAVTVSESTLGVCVA